MKRKVWNITVKDNPNRVVMGENDEFYTTDTEAYLVFKLEDKNFNPASAVLTLENRNDGSLKNETVDVVDGLIEWEMPQRYIEHFGNWQGQLVYEDTKDGQPELYTSAPFSFVVNAHIGDKKKPSLVEIENWEKFIRDGTELIETWEDMEDLRQANEAQRQANYQELLDTGVLQTNINTKLEALEEEYAPRLTDVTAQLAKTEIKKLDRGENESITTAMLSPEIKQALNDGEWNVNVNTSDIEQGAVTAEKINEEVGLFERISPKFIIGSTSSATGEFQADNYFMTTNYLLPFNLGDSIILIGGTDDIRLRIYYFDKQGQYINSSAAYSQSVEDRVFKSTVDGYVKLNLSKQGTPLPIITDVELVEFSKKIVLVSNRLKSIDEKVKPKPNSVDTEVITDGAVTEEKLDETLGVFAKEYHDFELGYVGPATGEFFNAVNEIVTINYVPVYKGERLVFKGSPTPSNKVARVFYYDLNKNYVKASLNYTEREVDWVIEIETDGYIKYIIRYSPLVELTDSMIAELSSSVYLHRNTIRGSWGKVSGQSGGGSLSSEESVEKTITLEMEASNINKTDGLITNATIDNIDIDVFKSTLRTGKFLKVVPSTNVMLNFSDGNAFLFEYDSEFEYLGYTEMTTNSPIQLKNNTSLIKISIEEINNGYIRPQLTYLGGANSTDWVFNAHKPNRVFDNINFIYETSTNEGRDILETDSSEKQYTDERYFSSGLLKLPPNYDPHGEPVKLILWFQGSGTYAGIHGHTFGNAYEDYFDYLVDEGYAMLSVYQWTTKYNLIGNNNGSPTSISAIVQGYKWATKNYNISTTGAFVGGKSSGGYNGTNICYNRGIPILASGLHCPVIAPLRDRGGATYDMRLGYAQDFGFEGDHSVLENKEGSAWPKETESLHDYLRVNAPKTIGYNPFWNGLIGENLTDLIEAVIDGTQMDYNLNKDKVRICHVPTKIWTAEDDHVQTARDSKIYIKSIQNGQGNAELRLMPNGTGGHNSTDSHENALKVDSITTKLGIEHTNVPLAYVELVQYFRRFEN